MESDQEKHNDYLRTLWERIQYVEFPNIKLPASSVIVMKQEVYNFIKEVYPDYKFSNYRIIKDEKNWNFLKFLKHVETVIVIGGGRLIDTVRYVADDCGINIVTVPSSLQTHMYISPKVHVPGEPVARTLDFPTTYIDRNLLQKAYDKNQRFILDGFGDIMAVMSAIHDLENKDPFIEQQVNWLISCLDSIDIDRPLSEWLDYYVAMQAMLVHLSVWEPAVVSGSEHCFALTSEDFVHSHLVGLGIRLAYKLQKRDDREVLRLLDKFGLPTHPKQIKLTLKHTAEMMKEAEKIAKKKGRKTIYKTRRPIERYNQIVKEVFK